MGAMNLNPLRGLRILAVALAVTPASVALGNSPVPTTPVPADTAPGYDVETTVGGITTYQLSHTKIVPSSVVVRLGPRALTAGSEYTLDAAAGTVTLSTPADFGQSLRVDYRYSDFTDITRRLLGIGHLQFGVDSPTGLGLYLGSGLDKNGDALVSPTAGISIEQHLAGNATGGFGGIVLFSQVERQHFLSNAPVAQVPSGQNQFILQHGAAKLGQFSAHFAYQNVGQQFNGYEQLQGQDGVTAASLATLKAQAGTTRLNFGTAIDLGSAGKPAGGASFDFNSIADSTGTISSLAGGLAAGGLNLTYSHRTVSQGFKSFGALADADGKQWSHEVGLTTSSLAGALNLGGKNNSLTFSQNSWSGSTGGVSNVALGVQSGSLNASWFARSAGSGFTRLADLSQRDRMALAQNIYQAYGAPKDVTAADADVISHEAGLSRSAFALSSGLGKGASFSIAQSNVSDSGPTRPAFARDAFGLTTGAVTFGWVHRRASQDFSRINDLTAIERTAIALDIRRQFDPLATTASLTQKDKDQAALEAGLDRSIAGMRWTIGKSAFLQLTQSTLTDVTTAAGTADPNRSIQRTAFDYQSPRLQIAYGTRAIGEGFTRLSALSDFEKSKYANEQGLATTSLAVAWQLDKHTHLAFDSVAVRGTADSVSAARANALQSGADPVAAARAAAAGARIQHLEIATKGLLLRSRVAQSGTDFSRASDLALPAADKALLATERGARSAEVLFRFDAVKGLTVNSDTYRAATSAGDMAHATWKQDLEYKPDKHLTLNIARNGDTTTANSVLNGVAHELMRLTEAFGAGFSFELLGDDNTTYSNGAIQQGTHLREFKFATPKAGKESLALDSSRTQFDDGRWENANTLNFHLKPTGVFSLDYDHAQVQRDAADESLSTDKVAFDWKATRSFSVIGGVTSTNTSDENNKLNAVSIGLKGDPVKSLTLAAAFDEVHQVAGNTKDVADVSLSNSKPIQIGAVRDLTFTARYASLNDQRKLMNETMAGKAVWKLWKNEFLFDYGGTSNPDQTSSISRTYQFVTDPTPSRWFHGSFMYKARTLISGQEVPIRKFSTDARLSRHSHFTYAFGSYPEDDKGNITPQATMDVEFKQDFVKSAALTLFYKSSANDATKLLTRQLGLGYEMPIGPAGKLGFAFSRDAYGFPDKYYRSNHLNLTYERPIDATHLFSLGLELKLNEGNVVASEVLGHLDFEYRF